MRLALNGLGESNSPASFKLRLSNCLQEEAVRRQRPWIRPLALGLAFVAALAILLWPDQDDELVEYQRREMQENQRLEWIPAGSPPLGRPWIGNFAEPPYSAPHSHAQVRTVAF